MSEFEHLVAQARRDLVGEAESIADTESALVDLHAGIRPIGELTVTQPGGGGARRRLATISAGLLVAAAVAGLIVVGSKDPAREDVDVPATEIARSTDVVVPATEIARSTDVVVPATANETPTTAALAPPTTSAAPTAFTLTPPTVAESTDQPPATVGPQPSDTSTDRLVPFSRWEPLDRGPLSARWFPVVVTAGDEIVVLGGFNVAGPFDDGAAYDPFGPPNGAWRPLPDAQGLFAQATFAVPVGPDTPDLLVVGGLERIAVYNLVTGEQSPVEMPPFAATEFGVAGSSIVATNEPYSDVAPEIRVARLSIDRWTAGWEDLGSLDVSFGRGAFEIAGELAVVGGLVAPERLNTGNQYDPKAFVRRDGRWIDLDVPVQEWGDFFAATDGRRLLMWAGHGGQGFDDPSMAWDPANGTWDTLTDLGRAWWECTVEAQPIRGGLFVNECGTPVIFRSQDALVTAYRDEPDLQMGGKGATVELAVLGDVVYRWYHPGDYVEGADPTADSSFTRLVLLPE